MGKPYRVPSLPAHGKEQHQILRLMHVRAGLEAPAEDVPLPEEWLPREDGDATADLLFVADFSSQFAKVLKVKPPTYQDLVGLLESGEPGSADLAESLWDLYEGLVKLVLQVLTVFPFHPTEKKLVE